MGSIVADESSVRVALRIRPQISRELIDGSKCCTTVAEGIPQVWIGSDHAYTYDYVFDTGSTQESVFESVKGLVDGCLDGYNATILAYGQTGSGKTYTMGTGFDVETRNFSEISASQGVIPRAVHMIFDSILRRRDLAQESGQPLPEFNVTAQFVELYNEEVFDLIEGSGKTSSPLPSNSSLPIVATKSASTDSGRVKNNRVNPSPATPTRTRSKPVEGKHSVFPYPSPSPSTHKPPTNGGIQIREDAVGAIYLVGVGTKGVATAEDALKCLYNGALSRTTASTNMNDESSRSHAIFTLHVQQQRIIRGEDEMDTGGISDCETLSAKFHFVDLAGSERLKRTGAVGHRAKESISINSGLLSLGNVISALGDKSKKASHVPYRDSKLTRLLQDSLGGNSRTMMIACVSPSERDFLETLNTLKYANRARNIKNKVTVNQDKNSNVISELKRTVHMLEEELAEYRQGKRLASGTHSDTHQENILLQSENQALTSRVKSLQLTIDSLNAKNSQLLAEKATGTWILADNNANCDLTLMVQNYIQEIEELGSKLYESEANCEQLRKKMEKERSLSLSPRKLSQVMVRDQDLESLIEVAKKEVEHDMVKVERLESRQRNHVDDDIMEDDDEDDSNSSCTEDSSADQHNVELAQLTTEITTKQRLIDQLELSQRRLEGMRAQYEEKLICLSQRIKVTQEERDKVLANMGGNNGNSQQGGKLKQVKEDYEKKLLGMNAELKKWQLAHKEHQKMIRNQAQHDRQLQTLRSEVDGMKRIKVKLMNQVKEENARRREVELQRNKEIAQLKKAERVKDNAIRTLQTENQRKELVLKRKHEEVTALKKRTQSNLSRKAGGRLPNSPVKLKSKWLSLRSRMIRTSSNKQTVENLEREMLTDISERTKLIMERDELEKEQSNDDVLDQLDTISTTIEFLDQKINECKKNILELTQKEEGIGFLQLKGLSLDECIYLMEKLYQQSLDDLCVSAEMGKTNGLLESVNKELENELILLRDLLMHMYNKTVMEDIPPEFAVKLMSIKSGFVAGDGDIPEPESADESPAVFDQTYITNKRSGLLVDGQPSAATRKARRLNTTPIDLLGPPIVDNKDNVENVFVNPNDLDFPVGLNRINSTRGSKRLQRRDTYCISSDPIIEPSLIPSPGRRTFTKTEINSSQPNLNATFVKGSTKLPKEELNTTFLEEKQESTVKLNRSPPSSPSASRRNKKQDNNNTERLTRTISTDEIKKGTIREVRLKMPKTPFAQTHQASGHNDTVQSIFATDNKLFTGSKDTTVKLWDLTTGVELQTLTGHPSSVTSIRCVESNGFFLTASSCYVKAWDQRMSSCFKTLLSSGVHQEGSLNFSTNGTSDLPSGEVEIQDMIVSSSYGLYTTFGEKVRIWDLRYFRPIGLLGGKHGSSVTCMASSEVLGEKERLLTGSMDRSVKLYDFHSTEPTMNISVPEKATLPHSDPIVSLAVSNSTLFSATSGTHSINKWNLTKEPVMVKSMSKPHCNLITGLTFCPNNDAKLVSTSNDGYMKLWSSETCSRLASVKTKNGINCAARNKDLLFVGSQDNNVGFWRVDDASSNN